VADTAVYATVAVMATVIVAPIVVVAMATAIAVAVVVVVALDRGAQWALVALLLLVQVVVLAPAPEEMAVALANVPIDAGRLIIMGDRQSSWLPRLPIVPCSPILLKLMNEKG
jgi:hypothetical protein